MNSVSEVLQALIQIPSVNPDGEATPKNTGEKACALWVGDFLESCGAEVSFEEVLPDRPNVIGRFPSSNSVGPSLLFAPHLDTVSVAGMTIDPFSGETREGKIWGRGASDTKGTMAAMLWAFHTLGDSLKRLNARVSFVGLVGEETNQPGSRHFARNHADEFDFAIVGEPTGLNVVHTHKGCLWVRLEARGKAVHGSTPELGENAILKLHRVIGSLLEELENQFPRFGDDALGRPTVSLGTFRGGSRTNIVPDAAQATLDIRETPALREAGGALNLIRDFLDRRGWSETVEITVLTESATLWTDPELDEIRRFLSMGSQLISAPWFCDAGWLSQGGIPSIALGPGSIAQAHTEDEYIAVEDLEAGADYYRSFLESYLSANERD